MGSLDTHNQTINEHLKPFRNVIETIKALPKKDWPEAEIFEKSHTMRTIDPVNARRVLMRRLVEEGLEPANASRTMDVWEADIRENQVPSAGLRSGSKKGRE